MAAAAEEEDTPKRRARLSARQPPGTIHGKTVFATFFLATGYLAFCFFSPQNGSSTSGHGKREKKNVLEKDNTLGPPPAKVKWWTPSNR